jgi:hypothetical protein
MFHFRRVLFDVKYNLEKVVSRVEERKWWQFWKPKTVDKEIIDLIRYVDSVLRMYREDGVEEDLTPTKEPGVIYNEKPEEFESWIQFYKYLRDRYGWSLGAKTHLVVKQRGFNTPWSQPYSLILTSYEVTRIYNWEYMLEMIMSEYPEFTHDQVLRISDSLYSSMYTSPEDVRAIEDKLKLFIRHEARY